MQSRPTPFALTGGCTVAVEPARQLGGEKVVYRQGNRRAS